MLFLSDITTANGRQINKQHLVPTSAKLDNSDYEFAREEPTHSDWTAWIVFWTRFTHPGLYLIDPVGEWTAPTHRKWTWFYDTQEGIVEHLTNGGTEYYHLLQSRTHTRGEQIYVKLRTEIGHKSCGSPATVTFLDETLV